VLLNDRTLYFSDSLKAKINGRSNDDYLDGIASLYDCSTVPQFSISWKYVREMIQPSRLKHKQSLHFFKKGIKPVWEDSKNKNGGSLSIFPPMKILDIVWETVMILIAGNILDKNEELCGAGMYISPSKICKEDSALVEI
jgi:hypothetical protein